jgi:hypothetical protein
MESVRKVGWAIKSRRDKSEVVTLSYQMHSTPEEAIRAYELETGKSWAEHLAEGASLVKQEIIEILRPPTSSE